MVTRISGYAGVVAIAALIIEGALALMSPVLQHPSLAVLALPIPIGAVATVLAITTGHLARAHANRAGRPKPVPLGMILGYGICGLLALSALTFMAIRS